MEKGDIVIFKASSVGSILYALEGTEFEVLEIPRPGGSFCDVKCILLPKNKKEIKTLLGTTKIGSILRMRDANFIPKIIPKPYVHVPIKHAYFYHSVGD